MTQDKIIIETQNWLRSVIIGLNFCPFAHKVDDQQRIFYEVCEDTDWHHCLEALAVEFEKLDADDHRETTLLIYPQAFPNFDDYLDFVEAAENLLGDLDYEGIYQLASFHPDYQFEGSDIGDAANYTNRSPHPMLHIIREESIERALETYPHPEQLPERNIELARSLGLTKMQSLLKACYHTSTGRRVTARGLLTNFVFCQTRIIAYERRQY